MGETYEDAGVEHRRRRGGGRAHQGQGPLDLPARGDRRHRRLRRAVRLRPPPLPPAGARVVDRRRRHQGAGGPGRRPVRHHRHRPGGHVRRRPRVPGRRAAVLPRLHRRRPARPRPHRAAGRGRGRGLPPGRVRADRRRDGRAPGGDGAGRVRPGRLRRRRGRARPDDHRRPRSPPGDVLIGLPSPGLRSNGYSLARRVLLDAAGAPLDGPAFEGAHHTPGRRAARAVGDLRPGRRARCSAPSTCAASPTSPAAASRATCTACCPSGVDAVVDAALVGAAADLRRDPAARRDRRRRDGARSSTSASAWSPSSPPRTPTRPSTSCRAAGVRATEIGVVEKGHGTSATPDRHEVPDTSWRSVGPGDGAPVALLAGGAAHPVALLPARDPQRDAGQAHERRR